MSKQDEKQAAAAAKAEAAKLEAEKAKVAAAKAAEKAKAEAAKEAEKAAKAAEKAKLDAAKAAEKAKLVAEKAAEKAKAEAAKEAEKAAKAAEREKLKAEKAAAKEARKGQPRAPKPWEDLEPGAQQKMPREGSVAYKTLELRKATKGATIEDIQNTIGEKHTARTLINWMHRELGFGFVMTKTTQKINSLAPNIKVPTPKAAE